VELKKRGYQVSRRRIGRIMKQKGLVSNYTVAQFRTHIDHCNESKAFTMVKKKLNHIQIFHTDRGNEFKNELIDNTLSAFGISRSLSMKGCPYDNAVAEATFKIIKTEFVRNHTFDTLNDLSYRLADYVNWFNHHRIHSSLGYLTPSQYKHDNLKKVV